MPLCLGNVYVLNQLDGEGARIMERQQELASKESYKEHILKEIAERNAGANIHDLRNDSHQELTTERVNQALNPTTHFHNISRSDHDMGSRNDHDMESMHSLPPSIETEIKRYVNTNNTTL